MKAAQINLLQTLMRMPTLTMVLVPIATEQKALMLLFISARFQPEIKLPLTY